jgi:hypothetical protein
MQLSYPFMGMWIATHERLKRYMSHPFWKKENLLQSNYMEWGYAERSNSGLLWTDVPQGFLTTNLVPYDPTRRILLPIGHVSHERNAYSSKGFDPPFSHIEASHLFRPEVTKDR